MASVFKLYQIELDHHHDTHEQLIKISRDVTVASKRCIFLLHRAADWPRKRKLTLKQAKAELDNIHDGLLGKIAEYIKMDTHIYAKAYYPGLEEYVEAITFYYFLQESRLISLNDLHHIAPLAGKLITPYSYAGGIADLSGELMRMCINVSATATGNLPYQICLFVHTLFVQFIALTRNNRELLIKCKQIEQNLAKIEKACYEVKLRNTEVVESC